MSGQIQDKGGSDREKLPQADHTTNRQQDGNHTGKTISGKWDAGVTTGAGWDTQTLRAGSRRQRRGHVQNKAGNNAFKINETKHNLRWLDE